jgi:transcriptional regulator with GAF, ATPase, and Fis domain
MNEEGAGEVTTPLGRILNAVAAMRSGSFAPGLLGDLEAGSGDLAHVAQALAELAQRVTVRERQLGLLRRVIPIGVALSAEKDFNRLLETLVVEAQSVTNADAGTLYLREDDTLKFVIFRNTSLNVRMGGTSGNAISLAPVRMYKEDGDENRSNIASYAALTRHPVRIDDAYEAVGFDFAGTKAFDARTGYRSKSFLTMPLLNAEERVIGVLQLINAQDAKSGGTVPFADDDILESLVLLATAALDGYIREASLRHEIVRLQIEIDETRRAHQVAEITDTSYFRDLKAEAARLRLRRTKEEPPK